MKVVSGTVDFSSRPRMIRCYLCGKEYGSKSIAIHQPQCRSRWLRAESAKPAGQRRALPKPPPEPYLDAHDSRAAVASRGGDARHKRDADADADADGDGASFAPSSRRAARVDAYNEAAYQVWCQTALQRCVHCQRSFTEEAHASHRRSCTAERPARKVGEKVFEVPFGGGGAAVAPPPPEQIRREKEAAAAGPKRGKIFPEGLAARLEGRDGAGGTRGGTRSREDKHAQTLRGDSAAHSIGCLRRHSQRWAASSSSTYAAAAATETTRVHTRASAGGGGSQRGEDTRRRYVSTLSDAAPSTSPRGGAAFARSPGGGGGGGGEGRYPYGGGGGGGGGFGRGGGTAPGSTRLSSASGPGAAPGWGGSGGGRAMLTRATSSSSARVAAAGCVQPSTWTSTAVRTSVEVGICGGGGGDDGGREGGDGLGGGLCGQNVRSGGGGGGGGGGGVSFGFPRRPMSRAKTATLAKGRSGLFRYQGADWGRTGVTPSVGTAFDNDSGGRGGGVGDGIEALRQTAGGGGGGGGGYDEDGEGLLHSSASQLGGFAAASVHLPEGATLGSLSAATASSSPPSDCLPIQDCPPSPPLRPYTSPVGFFL